MDFHLALPHIKVYLLCIAPITMQLYLILFLYYAAGSLLPDLLDFGGGFEFFDGPFFGVQCVTLSVQFKLFIIGLFFV